VPGVLSGGKIPTRMRFLVERVTDVPPWVLIIAVGGVFLASLIAGSDTYQDTLRFIGTGLAITVRLSLLGFAMALILGLLAGIAGASSQPILNTISGVYVELGRGLPLLVQILYFGYVVAPAISDLTGIGSIDHAWRAVMGLAFCSGAYQAEVFRAGIEAIHRGQWEAARSLGMNYFQTMRYIILPQAFRIVLPPLGNNFIAMVKDTSLASALGVTEITQLARVNAARTLDFFTTWNTATILYLIMTVTLSLGVQIMERRLSRGK